jgi:hypothetical protein
MRCTWSGLTRQGALISVLLALAVLALTTVFSPAAAASERSAAIDAATGRMIVSPSDEALVKGNLARVAFRPPAGTRRLWVRLNDRRVTARFGRSGSRRVASLSTRDGLRYGTNTISVLVRRANGSSLFESRSFVFGRRVPGLAHLNLDPGPVTPVSLRVAAPALTPTVFDSGRAFNRTLAAIRRDRRVRIRLNGKPVTDDFNTPRPTLWRTSLSATQGVRHGVNRLRALVLEPDTGRYEVLRRQFFVPRDALLPAAGTDPARPLGADRMPLDARDSVGDGSGSLSYRWRFLSKPRGSRATLESPNSATPLFDPDRPGRYRLGVQVTDPTNPQASSSTTDEVDPVVGPSQLLIPFTGFLPRRAPGGDPDFSGVRVGGKFYPRGRPGSFQWLTLNRETLKPIDDETGWFSPTLDDPHHNLQAVEDALKDAGHGELMILAHEGGSSVPPFDSDDQVDQFNRILKTLGVEKIDPDTLRGDASRNQQLVVVGVPYGGDGSGYYSQVFHETQKPVLNGFLMPDSYEATPNTPLYRFQPERVKFDTFNGTNLGGSLRNEMHLGGVTVSAHPQSTLAAFGGFQVVAIDPDTFEPIDPVADNKTFVTSPAQGGAGDAVDQREAMATYLKQLADRRVLVAVQSIGQVSKDPPPRADREGSAAALSAWKDLDNAMRALGANPHTFYETDGHSNDGGAYAFIGGPMLERSEMVDSSSAVVVNRTPEHKDVRESGSLQGLASIRADGLMKPAVADPSDKLPFELYDIEFQSPTPWPHTDPSDPEAGAYSRALAYVSTCLPQFKGWGPDLRSAYAGSLDLHYIAAKGILDELPYPDSTADRTKCKGMWDFTKDPGFTRDQYSQLTDELDQEFIWLDSIQALFGAAQAALGRSAGQQQVDLKSIGERIKKGIPPPSPGAEIGEAIGRFILGLFEVAGELAESASGLSFVAAVTAIYELSTDIASASDSGEPLGDKIDAKVNDLADETAARLSASADGLDRLQQVIISDYGRLKALGTVANTPAYTIDKATSSRQMTVAAEGWFSTALLPLLYGIHYLYPYGHNTTTTKECYVSIPAGHLFSQEPDSAQIQWYGDFNRDRFYSKFPQPSLLALGLNNLHDGPPYVPSEDLANSIFHLQAQGGYGVQLQQFIWEYPDRDVPPPPPPPTGIIKCNL